MRGRPRPSTGERGAGRLAYGAFIGLAILDASGAGVIAPVLPEIEDATGGGPGVMSALVAVFGLGMALGFYPGGIVVQRRGAAAGLALSLLLIAIGAAAFALVESLPLYFLSRLLMGFGSGGLWMGLTLGVMERWPGQEYRRLGGVLACYAIGGIVGPALGAIEGIRGPFLAYLGLVALASVTLLAIGPPHRHAPTFASDRAALRSPAFAVSASAVVLLSVTLGILDGVLPLHFSERLGQAGISALYVGTSLVVAVFAVIAPRLPLRATLLAATVLIVLGIGLAGAGGSVWVWIAALAMAGAGFGLGESASLGYLLEAIGPERMLLALIVWSQIFAVAFMIGAPVGGVVAETLGYGAIVILPLGVGIAVFVGLARMPARATLSA